MKAFKPDGSRWYTPTHAEVMDRWLADPELIGWFRNTLELDAATQLAELSAALMPRVLDKYTQMQMRLVAMRLRTRREKLQQARDGAKVKPADATCGNPSCPICSGKGKLN